MGTPTNSRLQVVISHLRSAIESVIERDKIDFGEIRQAVQWLQRASNAGPDPMHGDLLQTAVMLFVQPALNAALGGAYAHPEKDGATPWDMEGPAYLPGAPLLQSHCVLPIRPDEPGEPLIISGVVRSTTGKPLAGAIIDVWQN